ncbi:unnamed protein product [Sphenostylis stenocarpa]|uniref:Uncharacterized protein n=1 Tax=Sphenostylis stenocarpa TaxID=92480 RepID=A0AA86SYW2_9FABA|nr:unnamed protein product [Sphenostylis stenocarpa]
MSSLPSLKRSKLFVKILTNACSSKLMKDQGGVMILIQDAMVILVQGGVMILIQDAMVILVQGGTMVDVIKMVRMNKVGVVIETIRMQQIYM